MRIKILSNRRGAIFITTILCLLFMVLTGGALYQLSSQEMSFIQRLNRSLKAYSLAEAGLAKALAILAADFTKWNNASNFPLTTLDGGTFHASISKTNDRVLVSSDGVYQNVTRTVSAEVTPPLVSALNFALCAGSPTTPLNWDPGVGHSDGTVTGDIYSASGMTLGGTVNGDVYSANGTATGGAVSGTRYDNCGTVVGFPVVDTAYYKGIAVANGLYFSGDKTYNSGTIPANPPGGVIFVSGNITIYGVQNTTACIIATDNITMTKAGSTRPQVAINAPTGFPALVTLNGSITVSSPGNASGGAALTVTGLVYSGSNFEIDGNHYDNPRVDISGGIIARGSLTSAVTAQNHLTITYVQQHLTHVSVPNATMTIRSYNR